MTIAGFFWGLAIAGIGILLILKHDFMVDNFGRIAWAEEHLGTEGGSRLFYKLLGLLIILLGFGIMFNIWQPLFFKAAAPAFKGL